MRGAVTRVRPVTALARITPAVMTWMFSCARLSAWLHPVMSHPWQRVPSQIRQAPFLVDMDTMVECLTLRMFRGLANPGSGAAYMEALTQRLSDQTITTGRSKGGHAEDLATLQSRAAVDDDGNA